MEIIRASGIQTFMYVKVLAGFNFLKGMRAVRALQQIFVIVLVLMFIKSGTADFAEELSLGTVIAVQVFRRGIAARAGAVRRDIGIAAVFDRLDFLTITPFEIGNEILIVPNFPDNNSGKFVNFIFLVFRRQGILVSPLFEGNVAADKMDEPAVLLIKILNYL